jgi:hypothetical protein
MRRRPLLRGVAVAGAGALAGSAIAKRHAQSQQSDAATESEVDDQQDEQAEQPDQPQAAAAPAPDRIKELKDLAALRDSGALTDSEFATEKARVLQG